MRCVSCRYYVILSNWRSYCCKIDKPVKPCHPACQFFLMRVRHRKNPYA